MDILAVADIHSRIGYVRRLVEKIEKVDVVAIAGDITNFGSVDFALHIVSLFRKVCKNVVFVPGNCDDPKLTKIDGKNNSINIHGKYFTVNDIVFLGVGGSNITPFHTPIEYSENELWNILSKLLNLSGVKKYRVKILVSHTPPYNTKLDLTFLKTHVGSISIRRAIETLKPKLCICGHIHEAKGVDTIGETVIIIPGPLMRKHYALVRINGNRVDVELKTL